jgi:hypothetical protein
LPITGDISFVGEDEKLKRALLFWNRAAAQGIQYSIVP